MAAKPDLKLLPPAPERRVAAQRVKNQVFVPPERRKKDRRADWIHIPPGAKKADLDWLMQALKGKARSEASRAKKGGGLPQPGDGNKKTNSFNPFGHGHTGDPASDVRIQMQDEQDFQHGVQQEHAQLAQDVRDAPNAKSFLGKMKDRAAQQDAARQQRFAADDAARARDKERKARKPGPYGTPLPPYQGKSGNSDSHDQPYIKPRGPGASPGRRSNTKVIGPRPDVAPPMKRPPIPPAPKPIPKRGPLTGTPPLKRPPIPPAPKPKGKDKPFRTPPYKPSGGTGRILTFMTTKPRR